MLPDELTVSERNKAVKSIKNDGRINHLVIVQLSEIFDLCDAPLIEFEVILLEAECNLLEKVVDDHNYKVLMIAVQGPDQNRKEMYITILDLSRL